ncbi:AtpZ/AtpI family protein [Mucisphaera sp.]|uniref:AtpZ/AtpI family protein n=1 Tax=Mucisphaera sp. TaxID=2913024 RepID=UPI003D0BE9C6
MPLSTGSGSAATRYAAFGMELAGGVVVPIVIGLYVDHAWGTTPWGLLAGVAIGVISGGLSLTKLVVRVQRDNRRSEQDRS